MQHPQAPHAKLILCAPCQIFRGRDRTMPAPGSAVVRADDWARRGSAAVDARDLMTAKKCFSRAVELDRGSAERRFHLAVVLDALEEYVAAAEQLTEALRIDPKLTQAARRLSSLLSRHILAENARLNPLGLRAALQHEAVSRDAVADAALRYLSSRDPLRGALEYGRTNGWAPRRIALAAAVWESPA
jgi:tetratricopeptide (TPR) repeat protein